MGQAPRLRPFALIPSLSKGPKWVARGLDREGINTLRVSGLIELGNVAMYGGPSGGGVSRMWSGLDTWPDIHSHVNAIVFDL